MNNSSTLNTPSETPRETSPNEIIPKDKVAEDNKVTVEDNKVLPWDKTDHEIKIRSFSGYTIKLNGWIRHDIRNQRLTETKKNEAKEKDKEINNTDRDKVEINKESEETTKEQDGSKDKNI